MWIEGNGPLEQLVVSGDTVLSLIAVAGAIAALVFAYRQFRDARTTIDNLLQLESGMTSLSHTLQTTGHDTQLLLTEVQQAVSTRMVGDFPAYLEDIAQLVQGAQREIWICCDLPGYGMVSAQTKFAEYARFLEHKAIDGIPAHMLYLNKENRQLVQAEHFPTEEAWAAFKAPHIDGVTQLVADYPNGNITASDMTRDQFLETLGAAQVALLKRFAVAGRSVNITETRLLLPLYFWVADGRDAVFALTRYQDVREVGFRTSDAKLIQALIGIFERYRADGVVVKP